MKTFFNKLATVLLLVAIALNLSSCMNEELTSVNAAPMAKSRALANACGCTVVGLDTLPQFISSDRTLSCDTTYILTQKTYVTEGATLTIPAGTVIKGVKNSEPALASALIITKGCKLYANGTASCPVVFTSNEAEPAVGDWGGLVLLGRAPINQDSTVVTIEGIDLPSLPTGVDIHYGGAISDDNSGSLTYVRVEYAGAAISDANELNSFTFGGVGSGTYLSHLQAYYGADDAFEFFGGTVNAKYLIATAANDDAFDFDFGYRGKLQFLVAVLDPSAPYSSNANGIECDNDGTGTLANPFTRPVISNMTVVGTSNGATSGGGTVLYGAHYRRSARFVLRNSVLYGYKGKSGTAVVINLDGSNVYSKLGKNFSNTLSNDSSYMGNNVIGLISGATAYNPASPVTVGDSVRATTAMILRNPFNTDNYFSSLQKGLSATGNPALSGADFTGLVDTCFVSTTYKGALTDGNYWISDAWVNMNFPF